MGYDYRVPVHVWVAAALGSLGTLTSAIMDLRHVSSIDSVVFQLSVASGNPDIKIEWQQSEDGVTFDAVQTLIASTATTYAASPSGLNFSTINALLGRFIRFKLTDIATKATTVTLDIQLREHN